MFLRLFLARAAGLAGAWLVEALAEVWFLTTRSWLRGLGFAVEEDGIKFLSV